MNGPIYSFDHILTSRTSLGSRAQRFAMDAAGSNTSIETADVAQMVDELRKIACFAQLSRDTAAILRQSMMSGCINFYLRAPVSCTRMRATMSLFRRNHFVRWIAALMSIVWLVAFASPAASFAEAICHDLSDIAQQQVASSANHESTDQQWQASLKQTADADVCCKHCPAGEHCHSPAHHVPPLLSSPAGLTLAAAGKSMSIDTFSPFASVSLASAERPPQRI